jgi:hypothetical protein
LGSACFIIEKNTFGTTTMSFIGAIHLTENVVETLFFCFARKFEALKSNNKNNDGDKRKNNGAT